MSQLPLGALLSSPLARRSARALCGNGERLRGAVFAGLQPDTTGLVYRLVLWRLDLPFSDPPLVFCMANPSIADDKADDPTIRRCLGFAAREKRCGIVVVNVIPWIATNPADLNRAADRGEPVLIAEVSEEWQRRAFALGTVVYAWGASLGDWAEPRKQATLKLGGAGLCLGRTKDGGPRHPLMLASATPFEAYP